MARAIASVSVSSVRLLTSLLRVGMLIGVLVTVLLLSYILAWFLRHVPDALKGAQTRTESETTEDRE